MNKYLVFMLTGLLSANLALADKDVKFDLEKSVLTWTGTKLAGSHTGTLKLKEAEGEIKDDGSLTGDFEIDMTSLSVTDIEDPDYNKKLKDHLQSADFFNVQASPDVEFEITKAVPVEAGKSAYTVSGDLKIKGISKPVTFPAVVEVVDNKVTVKGKAVVNRIAYDIKYNSGSFFQNLGDKLIHDEFSVDLSLEGTVEE